MVFEPRIAFSLARQERPGLQVVVNFGVFAGREATAAEIDELAQELLPASKQLTIVAERRHEFDERSEAELHQVRIALPAESLPHNGNGDLDPLRELIVARAEHWARQCVERRHAEVTDV